MLAHLSILNVTYSLYLSLLAKANVYCLFYNIFGLCGEKEILYPILSKNENLRCYDEFWWCTAMVFIIAVAFAICFVLYAEWNLE